MKREMFEGGKPGSGGPAAAGGVAGPGPDTDPGLLEEKRVDVEQEFKMHSSRFDVQIKTIACI